MSDSLALLTEAADRLFADLGARRDEPFDGLWAEVERSGFTSLITPETEGGAGGDWRDAFALSRLVGVHALGLPVVEAIAAGSFANAFAASPPAGLTLIAPNCDGIVEDGLFTGKLAGAPWGRHATILVVSCEGRLVRVETKDATSTMLGENAAGEPRDSLRFDGAPVEIASCNSDAHTIAHAGALLRTAQIAGALDAALARSIDYANQRVQFGKPLAKFQAIQQCLALFAEEAAAVNCAGQAAAAAADRGAADMEIAAAKLRANMAASVGAAYAHQTHGAIGFTRDYGLHHFTGRLIAWRTEFGGEAYWSARLGAWVANTGADNIWNELVRRSETR